MQSSNSVSNHTIYSPITVASIILKYTLQCRFRSHSKPIAVLFCACRCQTKLTPCERITCANGDCQELPTANNATPIYAVCVCEPGWTGESCNKDIGD